MRSALNASTVAALTKLPSTSAHASAADSTNAGAGAHSWSPRARRRSISEAAWRDARATSTQRQPCSSCRQQIASHSLQLPTAPGEVAANAFDGSAAQTRDSSIRLGYQETAPSFERHGKRFRLDLDNTVAPADVQRRARFDRGFTTDLGRNHEAARRVDGGCHGMKCTMSSTMRHRD
jgi:hypothetical protein